MSEKKINIKKLNSFLVIDHDNTDHLELVQALYNSRESNISKIYDVIRLIFRREFLIYIQLVIAQNFVILIIITILFNHFP